MTVVCSPDQQDVEHFVSHILSCPTCCELLYMQGASETSIMTAATTLWLLNQAAEEGTCSQLSLGEVLSTNQNLRVSTRRKLVILGTKPSWGDPPFESTTDTTSTDESICLESTTVFGTESTLSSSSDSFAWPVRQNAFEIPADAPDSEWSKYVH
eukprot:Blabericola_migrator_1__13521@NODE_988_length_5794_cov_180_252314_g681_i0_p3_GENE_NODE_988_length_5794_cov_180_252314_g681_i0NODE_988_length_5794_cov_180_252314_g681_i0_p3_ORF_typecomplete_len155_score22_78_NODE_988_length_5794_cov_180_252314_g681_i042634727